MKPPLEPGFSRRALLKRGLWGSLLLGLGGMAWLSGRRGSGIPLPPDGLRILSPSEYALLAAVAERMVRPLPGAPSASEVGVALSADRVLELADPSAQRELKQLLGLLGNALTGFLFHGVTQPFTQLTPQAQDEVLSGWQSSALVLKRTGFQALHTLVLAVYYAAPATWSAIGYAGPPLP